MNRRMERLIPDDEPSREPSREPVDFQIAVAAVEAALELILAEFNTQSRKGDAA